MERSAQRLLFIQGCPPCYSAKDLLVEKEENGPLPFLQYFPIATGLALCNQWLDWCRFRIRQHDARCHHRLSNSLQSLEQEINQRRVAYGLWGKVHIEPDVERQSRLDTWFEFQDYHLTYHEGLEREINELYTELQELHENPAHGNYKELCDAMDREYSKWFTHKRFFEWTEKQRLLMSQSAAALTYDGIVMSDESRGYFLQPSGYCFAPGRTRRSAPERSDSIDSGSTPGSMFGSEDEGDENDCGVDGCVVDGCGLDGCGIDGCGEGNEHTYVEVSYDDDSSDDGSSWYGQGCSSCEEDNVDDSITENDADDEEGFDDAA